MYKLPPKARPIGHVVGLVAARFGVSVKEILGPQRTAKIVLPRQVAMFLAREVLNAKLIEIGKAIGGRDHTTAMNGIERTRELIRSDAGLRLKVTSLAAKLLDDLQLAEAARDDTLRHLLAAEQTANFPQKSGKTAVANDADDGAVSTPRRGGGVQ